MKFTTLIGYIGVLLLFVNALLSKEITVGTFFAVFMSIDTMFKVLEELISSNISRLTKNLGNIRNYINFLDIPESSGNIRLENKVHGISIRNLYFK